MLFPLSGHPEIYPLVLTEKTQEIFNCRADIDVTADNPYKLVKKEDIIQDMKTRAAISDFHPVKKIIQVSCPLLGMDTKRFGRHMDSDVNYLML